ncbi:MAG: SDR family oxidoreductase, partial [Clostridia bacterium]|nr:SDR family oxidoreductase [Clostridia bacterium]
AALLNARGYRVRWVYNDATVPESFESMIDHVARAEGKIDALINNFGGSDPRKDRDLEHTDPDFFLKTVELNLRSVFMSSHHAVKYMKEQGGSIVNISSIGGIVPDISQIAYGTAKAAINYLTKLTAVHEARHGIRCNAILPGMTATEAVEDNLSDGFRRLFLRHIPMGRMATPKEIADAAVYFASDESAYTTGQILSVSGGFGLASPIYSDARDKDR